MRFDKGHAPLLPFSTDKMAERCAEGLEMHAHHNCFHVPTLCEPCATALRMHNVQVPSANNRELSEATSLESGVGQNSCVVYLLPGKSICLSGSTSCPPPPPFRPNWLPKTMSWHMTWSMNQTPPSPPPPPPPPTLLRFVTPVFTMSVCPSVRLSTGYILVRSTFRSQTCYGGASSRAGESSKTCLPVT